MRIAATISGQPRFCKDFNTLLEHTKDLNIDWYVHLWSHNPPPDSPHNQDVYVADCWRYIDEAFAAREFAARLPTTHTLRAYTVTDYRTIAVPDITRRHCGPVDRIIYHWTSWRMVRDLIKAEYDWIIRTRADVGIDAPIPFHCLKQGRIYTANTQWHGYENKMNDLINVGCYNSIMWKLSMIEHYQNYLNKVKFHPETMVATHIKAGGYQITLGSFKEQFRTTFPNTDWAGWDYAAD